MLGKVFWSDALATLAGVDETELEGRLRGLERQEFVRRERRSAVEGARQYVFVHALLREVAYGQIPRAARSEKHRLTADWIAGLLLRPLRRPCRHTRPPSRIRHPVRGGRGAACRGSASSRGDRAQNAGDRAWALSLVSRAAHLYQRAVEMSGSDVDAELLFLNAQAQMWGQRSRRRAAAVRGGDRSAARGRQA